MNTDILSKDKDPMGAAILDYQKSGRAGRLRVLSSMFEEDEMPVAHLFRSEQEMPQLEKRALELVRGKVLDIGAGAGCHALVLKKKGFEVKAIDVSPLRSNEGSRNRRCGMYQPLRPSAARQVRHYSFAYERHGHCRQTRALADAAQPLEGTDG